MLILNAETVFAFAATNHVIYAEQVLLKSQFDVRIMPLPPVLRAGCGLCLRLPITKTEAAKNLLKKHSITGYSIYTRTVIDGKSTYTVFEGEFNTAGILLNLETAKQNIIAVIGCGGKTTLISSLANELRRKKVLVTTTTKIYPMAGKDIIICTTEQDCLKHKPQHGIQCLGVLNGLSGKLEALRHDLLEEIIQHYDLVLIEADGSKTLPCKGWLPDEPVIPPYCTHIIGVVSLAALGKPTNENTVHRLPEFSKLTGLRRGEIITIKALSDMIIADNGMFRNALDTTGKKSIFVNHADGETNAAAAKQLLAGIEEAQPGRFACLAYGSAQLNKFRIS